MNQGNTNAIALIDNAISLLDTTALDPKACLERAGIMRSEQVCAGATAWYEIHATVLGRIGTHVCQGVDTWYRFIRPSDLAKARDSLAQPQDILLLF